MIHTRRCCGITKDGSPCFNSGYYGGFFCRLHNAQAKKMKKVVKVVGKKVAKKVAKVIRHKRCSECKKIITKNRKPAYIRGQMHCAECFTKKMQWNGPRNNMYRKWY